MSPGANAGRRPARSVLHLDGSPAVRTLVAALALPLLHFAGHAFGFFGEAGKDLREGLLFGWLSFLGALALLQHHLLMRKVRAIWRERLRFETSLRHSEDDLRLLVERRHAEVELLASERSFAEAFRASPDALAITTARAGKFLEINDRFEESYGYRRGEIVGKTLREIGLLAQPEARHEIVAEIERSGTVRDREIELRHASGERRNVLFSAVTIDFDGERCLLSTTHDLPGGDPAGRSPPAALLERADDAFCIIDAGGRVSYWNPACEALYGWRAPDALGRPFAALVGHDLEAHRAARGAAGDNGEWVGELRQIAKDGRELRVAGRWSAIRDPSGCDGGYLVSSVEIAKAAGPGVDDVSLSPPCPADPHSAQPASSSPELSSS